MIARVKFNNTDSKAYSYRVPKELNPIKGDLVVVYADIFKVVKVVAIIEKPTKEQLDIATKSIVDTIDLTHFKKETK